MTRSTFTKSIFCFLAISVIEIGCCVIDSCGCDSTQGATRYKITGYGVQTRSGESVLAAEQTVRLQNLKIAITPQTEYITSLLRSGFKSLYACDPAPPAPTQNLIDLKITSDAELKLANKSFAAGESLNELFLLENGVNGGGSLSAFLKVPDIDAYNYDYILTIPTAVTTAQRHKFTIQIALSDNQKFTLTTTPVEFIP